MEVLRAYATKAAPARIIGANMTGSANYWYVLATSSIKTVKDITGRTIAYSKNGASGPYDVFDLMDRYRVRPRPMLTAGPTATFDQVAAGKIDVGWATPPFGIDAIEQSQIRIIARANDIPKIRDKTVHVMIAQADTLQKRRDVLARFVQGYRDTIEWMYSNPAALGSVRRLRRRIGKPRPALARRILHEGNGVTRQHQRLRCGCQRGEVRTVVEEATGRPRSNSGPAASSHRQALRMATGFSRPDRRDCQPPRPTSSFRIC